MAELKGIEFQITGSSDKASNSIKTLIDGLKNLKAALDSTQKAAKGSGTFKELAASIKDFKEALGGGFERYKKFAQSLEDIAAAAELLGEKTQHISDLATSMDKLSNAKISGAAFKNLADGMAAVGFSTKHISKESLDNLERMATSLAKLAGVDLKGLGSAMNAVSRGRSLEPPTPVGDDIREIIESGDQIEMLKLKLGELRTAMDGAFAKGDVSGAIRIRQQIASVEAEIERLENAANEVVPPVNRFKEALSSVGLVLSKVKSSVGKVASGLGKMLLFPFKSAGKDIAGYAKSLGGVIGGLKRIVGYRMIRSIIREITQGFSEGVKAVYQWSKIVGGPVDGAMMTFAAAMDDIATSLKYFKNGIGAAVAPLISALAPAIRVATDAAVEFLNVINQLMALLTGKSGWIRATRQAQEYEEAVGGAGGAAKEALRYLAPFDELNVLPSQKQGGGGGGADDYGGMFEEMVEFEQGIIDFADRIKKAIEDSDWQGLGTLLGDKINEIIDKIDFAELGTKIGKKINALFTTKYWTLDSINFQEIGGSIATFLNNAIDNIDFEIIGRSLSQKFTNIFDIAIGFVNELDFGDLGKALSDYVLGAIRELSEWIQSVDWSEFIHNLITGIIDFIANLQLGKILSAIGDLVGAIGGALIEMALAILKDVFTAVQDPEWWALVWAWFKENIVEGFANLGINIANALIGSMQDGLNSFAEIWNDSGLAKWLEENLNIEGVTWTIPTIEWDLIPKVEIDAGYEELKEKWDQKTRDDPVALQAAIESITDNLPEADHEFSVSGVLDSLIDQLEDSQKEVFVTAEVESVSAKRKPELPVAAEVSEIVESENIYELRGVVGVVESAEPSTELTMHPPGLYTRALYKWTDNSLLTRAQRTFNVWANYAWVKKDELTKEQRTIGTYSNFRWVRTAELTKDQKTINTYSNFKWVNTADLTKDQKTINTYSNFKWVKTGALTLAQKTLDVIGKYTSTAFTSLTAADRTIDATANFKGTKIDPSIQDYWGRVKIGATANIEGITGTTNITLSYDVIKANGGSFFGNAWHDIPQFASGGRPHGSLFLAGEAGAEIVGNIGGRTEVLNRSQIASSIYAAVRSAMSGLTFRTESAAASYSAEDSANEDAMYRAFSRALADSDLGGDVELDGDVLYRAIVNRNRRNTRMTGVNALG